MVSEQKALIASFLSRSAHVFTDNDCVGRWEHDGTYKNLHPKHVCSMWPYASVLDAIMALMSELLE